MAMNIDTFRASFPAFKDTLRFDVAMVSFWAQYAEARIPADRFAGMRDMAVMLFVAHNLVLEERNNKASAAGGSPGMITGTATSKSVGSVSVSYSDTSGSATDPRAGHWNETNYGRRYRELLRLGGKRALQL